MKNANDGDGGYVDIDLTGHLDDIIKREVSANIAMYSAKEIDEHDLKDKTLRNVDDEPLSEADKEAELKNLKVRKINRAIGSLKTQAKRWMRRFRESGGTCNIPNDDCLIVTDEFKLRRLKYATPAMVKEAFHYWQSKKALRDHEDNCMQLDFEFYITTVTVRLKDYYG